MGPKILFLDIETSPIIAAVWNLFEANAVWVESDTFILCFAAKWYGKKTKTYALPDYHGYRKYTDRDDKKLLGDLWKLLDEADIVVGHNSDAFDLKKINSRFAVHGYPPPSPFQTHDTLKAARKTFKFDSNKLDNLGRYLGEGRKIPNTGAALWRACRDGDRKAWKKMRRYNAQDVELDVRVYDRLKPWSRSHPNVNLWTKEHRHSERCPVCSSDQTIKRGVKHYKTRSVQQHKCLGCNHWFFGKTI